MKVDSCPIPIDSTILRKAGIIAPMKNISDVISFRVKKISFEKQIFDNITSIRKGFFLKTYSHMTSII